MKDEKTGSTQNMQALAAEACDLWQEHLASYATDPKAKAELMRLLEPTRRVFAEWAALVQHSTYGANLFSKTGPAGGQGSATAGATGGSQQRGETATAKGTATPGLSSGGCDVDVARLANRVAELEKKLARYESGAAEKTRKSKRPSGKRSAD